MLAHKIQDVGGPDKTGKGVGRGKAERKPTDIELMAFHGNNFAFWTEICNSLCLSHVQALIAFVFRYACGIHNDIRSQGVGG